MYALPGSDMPEQKIFVFVQFDKLAHFGTFAVYSCMVNIAISKQITKAYLCRKASFFTLIWCCCLGIILELIQGTLFVDRTKDMGDLLSNILGVFTGVVIFRLLYMQRSAG